MVDGREVEARTLGFDSALGTVPVLSATATTARVFTQVAGTALSMTAECLRRNVLRAQNY
jgi:hypothetical protein